MVLTRAAATGNFAAFRSHYGLGPEVAVVGSYTGSLADGGEMLTLRTSAGGETIASVTYGDGRGWPLPADGAGHSLVPLGIAEEGQPVGTLDYPGNWRASAFINGSPGRADPEPAATVVLNEIVAHTDAVDSNDWIEIRNNSTTNITLGTGWYLSDDPGNLKKWMIPPATTLPPGGLLSFDESTGFHPSENAGFGLSKEGEQVLLSYLPGTKEDRVVDSVAFEGQELGWSLGRYPDGAQYWQALTPSTRNTPNSPPRPGVVVTEFMYHPPDTNGTNDNSLLEYIVLLNASAGPVALFNSNGVWRLAGDVDLELPAGTTLPAGGRLVCVSFAAMNSAAKAGFAAAYQLDPAKLSLTGPYVGKLPNSSGRVALERPQAPDLPGEKVSWVIVDEVIYADNKPWPGEADGTGLALKRVLATVPGNDPLNWQTAKPNPASEGSPISDTDSDGLPDEWESAHGLNPRDPLDARLDSDGDGLTNLQEFVAGTDPRDPQSALKVTALRADNGQAKLRFQALAGTGGYTVQYVDSLAGLAPGAWQKLFDVPTPATSQEVEVTDANPPVNSQRYYRLVAPRQP